MNSWGDVRCEGMPGCISCVVQPGCEEEWAFGSAGQCNTTSGLCTCPEGYWGADDYQLFNQCHVNKGMQSGFYYVCLFMSSTLALHTTYGIITLLCRWGYAQRFLRWVRTRRLFRHEDQRIAAAQRGNASQVAGTGTATSRQGANGSLGFGSLNVAVGSIEADEAIVDVHVSSRRGSGGALGTRRGSNPVRSDVAQHGSQLGEVSLKTSAGGTMTKRARAMRRMHAETLLCMLLFWVYAIALTMYYIPEAFLGRFRWQGDVLMDVAVCIAVSSLFSGLWLLGYMWFRSLPRIDGDGKLHVSRRVINWQRFIKVLSIVNVIIVNAVSVATVVVLPLVAPERRPEWNRASLIAYCYFTISFVTYFTVLCAVVRCAFDRLILAVEGRQCDGDDPRPQPLNNVSPMVEVFKKARSAATVMLWMSIVLGSVSIPAALAAALVPFFQMRLHVSISVVGICASAVAHILSFLFVQSLNSSGSSRGGSDGGSAGADQGCEKTRLPSAVNSSKL
jgi:hypothetical protein